MKEKTQIRTGNSAEPLKDLTKQIFYKFYKLKFKHNIMTKFFSTFIFLFTLSISLTAQVGINTASPNASAALDVTSTDKGLLIPRVTSTANVTAPTAGMMVYQTGGTAGFYFYNGSWNLVGGGDNLGSHTATQNLNMANQDILASDSIRTRTIRYGSHSLDMVNEYVQTVLNMRSNVVPASLYSTSYLRILPATTPQSNCNLQGMAGGYPGKIMHIHNTHNLVTPHVFVINNETTNEPEPTHRIRTLTGANVTISNEGFATFVYDGSIQRWILMSVNQ
jgi:hypothetical protein